MGGGGGVTEIWDCENVCSCVVGPRRIFAGNTKQNFERFLNLTDKL